MKKFRFWRSYLQPERPRGIFTCMYRRFETFDRATAQKVLKFLQDYLLLNGIPRTKDKIKVKAKPINKLRQFGIMII